MDEEYGTLTPEEEAQVDASYRAECPPAPLPEGEPAICSARCPYCGTVPAFPLNVILAFICSVCGCSVKVEPPVQ